MKHNSYQKDIWRSISKGKKRFFAIMIITILGVTMFSGLIASCNDLRHSGDAFFDEQNLHDIVIMSTLGLTDDDVAALDKVDGIKKAEGTIACAGTGTVGDLQFSLTIQTLSPTGINTPCLTDGRLPETADEIAVTDIFLTKSGARIGDRLTVRLEEEETEDSGDEDDIEVDTESAAPRLTGSDFTITGTVISATNINNPVGAVSYRTSSASAYEVFVVPEAYESEIYTGIYLLVDGAQELFCYSDEYENRVDAVKSLIEEGIMHDREEARYREILLEATGIIDDAEADANEELEDAREELEEGEQTLKDELKDARKELEDAEKTLTDAEKELDKAENELNEKEAEANKEFADAHKQIEDGWATIAEKEQELKDGEAEIADGKKQMAEAEAQLEDGKAQLSAGEAELADGKRQLKEAEDQIAGALAQITDAEDQIAAGKAEIAAGEAQLADGKAQLEAGKQQIAQGKTEIAAAEAQMADAKTQIAAAEQQLAAGRIQLEAAKAALTAITKPLRDSIAQERAALELSHNTGLLPDFIYNQRLAQLDAREEAINAQFGPQEQQLAEQEAQLVAGEQELAAQKAQLEAGEQELKARKAELEAAEAQLPAEEARLKEAERVIAENKAKIAEAEAQLAKERQPLDAAAAEIAANKAELEAAEKTLNEKKAELAEGEKILKANKAELAQAEKQLAEGKVQLEEGKAELKENEKALNEAETDARKQIADGREEIKENRKTIKDGWRDLEKGRKEYEEGKAEGEEELSDGWAKYYDGKEEAEEKLAEAREKLKDIEMANWYIQDRTSLSGFANIASDADSIDSIGTVFPIVFFIIAILISLTTIARMVDEDRGLIGTYKALGYTDGEILRKYLTYSFSASALGGILGTIGAYVIIPLIIFVVFRVMYLLPHYSLLILPLYAISGPAIFIGGVVLATYLACRGELKETPASLMRPKTPRAGSRILLERIPAIWTRMSFLNKVTARNLFRYKRRMLMTVGGIAGCTALLLFGLSVRDSVHMLPVRQYAAITDYDLMAVSTGADNGKLLGYMKDDVIKDFINPEITTASVRQSAGEEINVTMVVIPDEADIEGYIGLFDKDTGESLSLDKGDIYITENAAYVLSFFPGDTVNIQLADLENADVTVTGLIETYLGNYVFMREATFEEHFEDFEPNAVYVLFKDDMTREQQLKYAEDFAEKKGVIQSLGTVQMVDQFEDAFMLINLVVYVVLVMSAALAFVVLFTLSTTNISERLRELATIKVLGFYDHEVHLYINKETLILTGLGILIGMPLGRLFAQSLSIVLKLPSITLPVTLKPMSYLVSAVLAFVFALVVDFITDRFLDAIDPVEALKSVE